MVNYGINSDNIIGILLLILGLLIVPLGLLFRKPFRVENLIQDIVFAPVYLLCGFILIFQGWRLDPILQVGQFLLIVSNFYWVIKDMLYRSYARR